MLMWGIVCIVIYGSYCGLSIVMIVINVCCGLIIIVCGLGCVWGRVIIGNFGGIFFMKLCL